MNIIRKIIIPLMNQNLTIEPVGKALYGQSL
jgi:hypothetical protein